MKLNHPRPGDTVNGLAWDWSDYQLIIYRELKQVDCPQFSILTWTQYSAETGEYMATASEWALDPDRKMLHLQSVAVRTLFNGWDNHFTRPESLLSDAHERKAREIARKAFGFKKLRGRTVYQPLDADGWQDA